MLYLSFSQGQPVGGALLHLSFVAEYRLPVSGSLLGLSFAQRNAVSGRLLGLSFTQAKRRPRRFKGSQAMGIGDYDIVVRIAGVRADMCRFAESMTITHGENQSYLCDFVLREDAGEADVYRWHGRQVTVDAVHDGGEIRLYQGIADVSTFDLRRRMRKVSCSDRRTLMMNTLPDSVVRAVGYTSVSAHGEFKDRAAEMEKRLETVPASFEFDANGTGYLTPWQPKAVPDRIIGNCVVYKREPSVRLSAVGRVVNQVKITLDNQFVRLHQRDLAYRFLSGYTVCDYAAWGLPPAIADIKSAARGAGWATGGWRWDGLAKEGFYDCMGSRIWWTPVARAQTNTQKGFTHTVQAMDYTNVYATNASWMASKRWQQNITERYVLTLANAASIGRYGLIEEETSYSVQHKFESGWGNDYTEWQDPPKGYLKTAGGWYQDQNGVNHAEFLATLQVAWHTAYTKMLSSHRQNVLSLEMKFLPELDLRHTHRIEHRNFTGSAKVGNFTHTFDFRSGIGQTAVEYYFYQNAADNGMLTPFALPERPQQAAVTSVAASVALGTINFPLGAKIDTKGLSGFITQTTQAAYTKMGRGIREQRRGVAFCVSTPEIEKESTDTATAKRKQGYEVNIFNNPAVIRLG